MSDQQVPDSDAPVTVTDLGPVAPGSIIVFCHLGLDDDAELLALVLEDIRRQVGHSDFVIVHLTDPSQFVEIAGTNDEAVEAVRRALALAGIPHVPDPADVYHHGTSEPS